MVFETTVLCFICFAALIGNVSLFIIVYEDRKLQTITNLFILNLAAADILVSLLSMPVTGVTIIEERWVFGHTACVAFGFLTIMSFIASVMSLGMIAVNRYFYIVKWNTYKKTFSKKKALLYTSAVWIISMSLSSPPLLGWGEYRFIPGKSYCFCILAFGRFFHVFYDRTVLFRSTFGHGIFLLQYSDVYSGFKKASRTFKEENCIHRASGTESKAYNIKYNTKWHRSWQ